MNKETILGILIIVILGNAMKLGWNIRKISNREFELVKKGNELDLAEFVERITNFEINY